MVHAIDTSYRATITSSTVQLYCTIRTVVVALPHCSTVVVLRSYIKGTYRDLGDVHTHRFRMAVVVIAVWGEVTDSERR